MLRAETPEGATSDVTGVRIPAALGCEGRETENAMTLTTTITTSAATTINNGLNRLRTAHPGSLWTTTSFRPPHFSEQTKRCAPTMTNLHSMLEMVRALSSPRDTAGVVAPFALARSAISESKDKYTRIESQFAWRRMTSDAARAHGGVRLVKKRK